MEVVRLSRKNIHRLPPLFKKSFNGQIVELQALLDKYDTPDLGDAFLGWMTVLNGEAVAYWGFIPCTVKLEGTVYKAVQYCDLMSDPAYRGQGYFGKTFAIAQQEIVTKGYDLIFGFASPDAEKVFIHKFQWDRFHNMHQYSVKAGFLPLQRMGYKLGWKGIYNTFAAKLLNQKFLRSADPFSESSSVQLSDEYILYKSIKKDVFIRNTPVKMIGKLSQGMAVGALMGKKQRLDKPMLNKLKSLAGRCGASEVTFSVSPGSANDIDLKKMGYTPVPGIPVIGKALRDRLPTNKLHFQYIDYNTF